MSAQIVVVTAESHKVEGSRSTGAAHPTPIEVFRFRPPCVEIVEVCAQDLHR